MSRKRLYTDRQAEQLDSFTRRVWIALDSPIRELPIGLPVNVLIAVEPKPEVHSGETSLEARQVSRRLHYNLTLAFGAAVRNPAESCASAGCCV